jgi:hypothetical protein
MLVDHVVDADLLRPPSHLMAMRIVRRAAGADEMNY